MIPTAWDVGIGFHHPGFYFAVLWQHKCAPDLLKYCNLNATTQKRVCGFGLITLVFCIVWKTLGRNEAWIRLLLMLLGVKIRKAVQRKQSIASSDLSSDVPKNVHGDLNWSSVQRDSKIRSHSWMCFCIAYRYDLMLQCWSRFPEIRPNFAEVLKVMDNFVEASNDAASPFSGAFIYRVSLAGGASTNQRKINSVMLNVLVLVDSIK